MQRGAYICGPGVLLWCVLVGAAGCATDSDSSDIPSEVRARVDGSGMPAAGKHLYMKYCQPCHGGRGRGDGPAADRFDTPPRDLTAGMFKFRSTPMSTLPTAGDLYRTLVQGVPGTAMPAWDDRLGDQELWDLVAYVQTIVPGYGDEARRPTADDVVDVPEAPPSTPEAIERGRGLFEQFGCTGCHGQAAEGDGPRAGELTDHKGRSIQPADFTDPFYKSGHRPEDLYRTLQTGLAGTPMVSYSGALKPNQMWDIIHYLRSLREERSFWDYLLATEPGRMEP